jgi:hypothetical protein
MNVGETFEDPAWLAVAVGAVAASRACVQCSDWSV